MALKHSVYDTDTHFTINPNTRVLKNESMGKTSLIQYDHNSERFTFEIPRMIEGHDMSLCDVVQIQYNNIDSQTKEQSKGVYDVDDMQIYSEDDNVVILSWLISGNATKYVGSLNFLVRFVCTDDEGTVIYAWNTAIYTGISVSSGINNGEAIAYEYADILEQWRAELEKGNNGDVWQELYDHEERIDNLENLQSTVEDLGTEFDFKTQVLNKRIADNTEVRINELVSTMMAVGGGYSFAYYGNGDFEVSAEERTNPSQEIQSFTNEIRLEDIPGLTTDCVFQLYLEGNVDDYATVRCVTTSTAGTTTTYNLVNGSNNINLTDVVSFICYLDILPVTSAFEYQGKLIMKASIKNHNIVAKLMNAPTVDEEAIDQAIEEALTEAKESGEFDGADGHTPVKGTDYFTAEDKAELVEDVLEALPTWTGGSY